MSWTCFSAKEPAREILKQDQGNAIFTVKDIITIKKLRIQANIGILPWELKKPQEIHVTIQYATDASKSAAQDDINLAMDYSAVREQVIQFVSTQRFNLIETLAEKCAQDLLNYFAISWVSVEIFKPTIFADADGVSIRVERP